MEDSSDDPVCPCALLAALYAASFPGRIFPQLPYASSNFTYSLLLFLVMLAGSLVLARRPNGLISFSRSAQVALCMLALILLAFVVLLLVFQKVGANPPLI